MTETDLMIVEERETDLTLMTEEKAIAMDLEAKVKEERKTHVEIMMTA